MTPPKVLIADEMSPRAAEILAGRGLEVETRTSLDAAELAEIIGERGSGSTISTWPPPPSAGWWS